MDIAKELSMEMGLTLNHTNNIINLLDEGCTIPFIARYRKEMTGSCDDQTLRTFDDRLRYLRNLNKSMIPNQMIFLLKAFWYQLMQKTGNGDFFKMMVKSLEAVLTMLIC